MNQAMILTVGQTGTPGSLCVELTLGGEVHREILTREQVVAKCNGIKTSFSLGNLWLTFAGRHGRLTKRTRRTFASFLLEAVNRELGDR